MWQFLAHLIFGYLGLLFHASEGGGQTREGVEIPVFDLKKWSLCKIVPGNHLFQLEAAPHFIGKRLSQMDNTYNMLQCFIPFETIYCVICVFTVGRIIVETFFRGLGTVIE